MKSQSDIFSLIKSLNGPEKRYFKIYAKRNSLKGKSNYITLFNLIDRQKEPDEKKLKLYLKKSNPNFGLAETKYQLQNIILKSLVAFYSESKPLLRINQMRSRIAILISKSLFKQSIVLIEKLKKESIAIGNFALVIDLISFERDVAYAMFSFGILDKKLTIW